MALYILTALGPRPSIAASIDRVDNDGHYAPGNLQWADRTRQNQNKRTYRVSATGERIRSLMLLRQDIGYETIRTWVRKEGLTDEQILSRKRTTSGRPRVRHTKLWPEA
jgi:hypothetical protein